MKKEKLPKKSEIFKHWKEWLDENMFDWGEPSCWACGFGFNDKYDLTNSKATPDSIAKLWDKVPLQRCHIVPESLGGLNSAENLFLMCRECHDLAPNTTFPEIFMIWAKNQNHFKRRMNEYKELMEVYELGNKDSNVDELIDKMNSQGFKDWLHQNSGLHWNQSGHGSKLTTSTYIGLFWKFCQLKTK